MTDPVHVAGFILTMPPVSSPLTWPPDRRWRGSADRCRSQGDKLPALHAITDPAGAVPTVQAAFQLMYRRCVFRPTDRRQVECRMQIAGCTPNLKELITRIERVAQHRRRLSWTTKAKHSLRPGITCQRVSFSAGIFRLRRRHAYAGAV